MRRRFCQCRRHHLGLRPRRVSVLVLTVQGQVAFAATAIVTDAGGGVDVSVALRHWFDETLLQADSEEEVLLPTHWFDETLLQESTS